LLPIFDCSPVDGPVWFSDKSFYELRGKKRLRHSAIDIFGQRFQPCRFFLPTKVIHFWESKKGGWCLWGEIEIDDKRYCIYFAHLNNIPFTSFDLGVVLPSKMIFGYMGNSGNAKRTRCHCHIQMYHAFQPLKWNPKTKRIVGKGKAINYVDVLKAVLKKEGRQKEKMRCRKKHAECTWCNPNAFD